MWNTLWDVLISALNVDLKAAYLPVLFKSDRSIFVFIFLMGALFRTQINLLVFVPFAQAVTTVYTWSHGFSVPWDFVHLVVNINVFWKKGSKRVCKGCRAGSGRARQQRCQQRKGVKLGSSLWVRWSRGSNTRWPNHTLTCVCLCLPPPARCLIHTNIHRATYLYLTFLAKSDVWQFVCHFNKTKLMI